MIYENIETLNSIFLRRKHRLVINNKKNLNEFFKLNIERAIGNNEYFSSSKYLVCVKKCNLLNCILTINYINKEVDVEFENGKLISDLPFKDTVLFDNLSALIEKETQIIRNKLNFAITLNENIASLGFYMDIEFVNNISLYDENEYNDFNFFLLSQLKKLVGSSVKYEPPYPEFPRKLIDEGSFYFYYCKWLYCLEHSKNYDTNIIPKSYKIFIENDEVIKSNPFYQFLFTFFFKVNEKIEILSVGTEEDFYFLMIHIMMSTQSFSTQDQYDLSYFFTNEKDYLKYLPETIVNKENLAHIVKYILNSHGNDPPTDTIIQKYDRKDVNDVLILIEVLSSNDVSSRGINIDFGYFNYPIKRLLLELLNHCENRYKKFVRKKRIWNNFFKNIDISDFKDEYPQLIEEINTLEKFNVFNNIYLRKRNKLIIYGDEDKNLDILFKMSIEEALKKDDVLSTSNYHITVKYCNLLNCTLTIDDREIEYENGKVISSRVIHNDLFMEHLNKIMEEEMVKIRAKLKIPLAINENISKLGYCLDINMMKIIASYDENEMEEFGEFLIPNLKNFMGTSIVYNPTFPNYLKPNISSSSLYYYYCKWIYHLERSVNNIFSDKAISLSYKKNKEIIKEIESEVDIFNWKAITLGDEKDFSSIIKELLEFTENYSSENINDLTNLMKYEKQCCLEYIPKSIPNKCNLAHITEIMKSIYSFNETLEIVSPLFTDVTDVLILALIISNHLVPKLDEEIQQFIRFNDLNQNFIMNLLNQCDPSTRNVSFLRYKNAWTRLCKVINLENYREKYTSLVNDLLSITKTRVFNSILLRRRKNIIMEEGRKKKEEDLDHYYQTIIKKAILNSEYLPSSGYSIKVKKCHLLYCLLTVNGVDIEYENGKKMSNEEVIKDISFIKWLNEFMEEQTIIIRNKLNLALSLNENLHNFGFYLDLEIVKRISFYSEIEMKEFSAFLISELQNNLVNKDLPFPNFPSDHLESHSFYPSYCTWLWNLERLLHYDETVLPMSYKNNFSEDEKLATELTDSNLKIISIGTEKEVYQIITNFFNSPETISPQDQTDLNEFIKCEKKHLDYLPETISNKENLVTITLMILKYHVNDPPIDKILSMFRNINDVLRLALVISGHNAGDLGKRKPFKSFKNSERRLFMRLLNHCTNRCEDLNKYRNTWSRFCEKVHPNKFKCLYPDLVNDLLGTYRFLGERNIKELREEYRFYQTLFELDQRLIAYMNENVKLIQEKQYVSEEDITIHYNCINNNNNNNNNNNQTHPIDDIIKRNKEINKLLKRNIPFNSEQHQKLLETFQKIKKNMPKELKTSLYKYLLKLSNIVTDSLIHINNTYAQPWCNPRKRFKLNYYQEIMNGWKENSFSIYHGLIPTLEIDVINERITTIQPYLSQVKEKVHTFRREHQTFNSRYIELLNTCRINEASKLLSQKPGVFLRQLNELLIKSNGNYQFILELMEQVAPKASVKVLLGLKGYYQKRNEKWKGRAFLIKGSDGSCKKNKNKSKDGKNYNYNFNNRKNPGNKKEVMTRTAIYFKDEITEPLPLNLCQQIIHLCDESLLLHFETKPKLNGVYISPELQNYLIPQDMREANQSMESFTKGTRFGLSFKNITKDMKEKIIHDLEKKLAEKKEKSNELYSKKKEKEIKLLNDYQNYYEIQQCKNQLQSIEKNLQFVEKEIEKVSHDLENQKKCPVGSTYNYVRLFIIGNTNFSIEVFDEDLTFKSSIPQYHIINEKKSNNVSKKRNKFGIRKINNSNNNSNNNEINIMENEENNEFKIYYGKNPTKYIDINFEAVRECGGRYIIVNVGTGKNIKFGWMEINSLNSDILFEPGSVRQILNLNCGDNICPLILDCKTREFIWIDYRLPYNYYRYYKYYFENINVRQGNSNTNTLHNDGDTSKNSVTYNKYYIQNVKIKQSLLYYYLNPLRLSISDLIHLHIKARGGTLLDKEEDLKADDTAFVTTMPYVKKEKVNYVSCNHLDVILSEYMK